MDSKPDYSGLMCERTCSMQKNAYRETYRVSGNSKQFTNGGSTNIPVFIQFCCHLRAAPYLLAPNDGADVFHGCPVSANRDLRVIEIALF